jgi:trehalose 6-phosphate synthase
LSRLIAVSNRIPKPGEGYSAGGLAVAVRNALERRGGLWLGWSGEIHEGKGSEPKVSQQHWSNVDYVTIDLSERDRDEYYNGFTNRVLWPLFHLRTDFTEFDRRDMAGYYRVNQIFAKVLAPMLRSDDVIWVHDYHFIPLASELRALGVKNRIGFFLHIPWPSPELFAILPNHLRLAANLVSYDLVGFQTRPFLDNFINYLSAETGAQVEQDGSVEVFGRRATFGVFPISIDTEDFRRLARAPQTSAARRLEHSLVGKALAISVDRVDYSKGIPQRFAAFARFLELYPDYRKRMTALQIAPPTREQIPEYADLNRHVAEVAGRINSTYGDIDWVPIRYVNRPVARSALAGLYRFARIGAVTPLRDGMNLVAKEYVAAQDETDPGVLIISRFAGAALELGGAILVNPYDIDGVAHALKTAFDMPTSERISRWKPMMRHLWEHDVHRWCDEFLLALTPETVEPLMSVAQ